MENNFLRIAEQLGSRGVCYTLAERTIDKILTVKVDGNEVGPDESNGYVFEAPTRQLCFRGSSIPKAGTKIHVEYESLADELLPKEQ